MDSTPLVDAQERAIKFPSTFELPGRGHLDRLKVGDFVKVCAEFPQQPDGCSGERFWLRIVERTVVGTVVERTVVGTVVSFVGVVEDYLLHTVRHGYQRGHRVPFQAQHVLTIG